MLSILMALGSRVVTPGLPDPLEAAVCFAFALAGTTVVGWWASRLEATRRKNEMDALSAATPAGGIH